MLTINWRVESISFILTETFKMFFKGISISKGVDISKDRGHLEKKVCKISHKFRIQVLFFMIEKKL